MKNLKQTITTITCLFIASFVLNAQALYINSGSEIYRVNPANCSKTLICSGVPAVLINGNYSGGSFNDIAFSSSGGLYVLMSQHLILIDTNTCTGTYVVSFPSAPSSLVGATNDIMYAANSNLYKVDLSVPSVTNLGALPCTSAGDLSFFNGILYMTCVGADLIQVDLMSPSSSTVVGNLGGVGYWFSLWVDHVSCGNSLLYASDGDEIYNLSVAPLSTTFSCDMGFAQYHFIDGATTSDEFLEVDCGPLPVKLKSFSANCASDYIQLDWSTGSESNNDYFTLERSFDGLNWKEVTTIDAVKNSNVSNSYSFLDFNVQNENKRVFYYRLTQTDNNGYKENLSIISKRCENTVASTIKIFPNPTDGKFIINGLTANSTIKIFDALGQLILHENSNSFEKSIDLSKIESGVYIIKINSENFNKESITRLVLY